MSATAYDVVGFNEYGDVLDRPYVVRALKPFDVSRMDDNFCVIEDAEPFHVDEGSVWEIYHTGSSNDVHLDGDGCYLELDWDGLKLFECIEEGGYDE